LVICIFSDPTFQTYSFKMSRNSQNIRNLVQQLMPKGGSTGGGRRGASGGGAGGLLASGGLAIGLGAAALVVNSSIFNGQ
jgi:hypothetical protein